MVCLFVSGKVMIRNIFPENMFCLRSFLFLKHSSSMFLPVLGFRCQMNPEAQVNSEQAVLTFLYSDFRGNGIATKLSLIFFLKLRKPNFHWKAMTKNDLSPLKVWEHLWGPNHGPRQLSPWKEQPGERLWRHISGGSGTGEFISGKSRRQRDVAWLLLLLWKTTGWQWQACSLFQTTSWTKSGSNAFKINHQVREIENVQRDNC